MLFFFLATSFWSKVCFCQDTCTLLLGGDNLVFGSLKGSRIVSDLEFVITRSFVTKSFLSLITSLISGTIPSSLVSSLKSSSSSVIKVLSELSSSYWTILLTLSFFLFLLVVITTGKGGVELSELTSLEVSDDEWLFWRQTFPVYSIEWNDGGAVVIPRIPV